MNHRDGAVIDVSARQCWERLQQEKKSVLIDVRTQAEWTYVGVPDLTPLQHEDFQQPLFVQWRHLGAPQPDPNFASSLTALLSGESAQPLFFLCRSGQRSRAAAEVMAQQGFSACFNVADGFEGGVDKHGHRGQKTGWKASGLPWRQT